MNDLAGKTAFVTGAGSGIGLGIARSFASRGMSLALADVEAPALEAAARELGSFGAEVLAVPLDVRDRQAFAGAADRVESRFGPVHVVCNNAGVSSGAGIVDGSWADWDWELGVNFHGVLNGVRAFVPRMLEHGEPAHVVNTASMSGLLPASSMGIYSTTKFAVVGLTESLRLELHGTNVGVSLLCPGLVRSRIAEADRNRAPSDGESTEAGRRRTRAFAKILGRGIVAEAVGERVVEAILRNELYVFTHPEYREPVRRRGEYLARAFRGATGSDAIMIEAFTRDVERLHESARAEQAPERGGTR